MFSHIRISLVSLVLFTDLDAIHPKYIVVELQKLARVSNTNTKRKERSQQELTLDIGVNKNCRFVDQFYNTLCNTDCSFKDKLIYYELTQAVFYPV